MEQQQGGGVERGGVVWQIQIQISSEGLSCRDSKIRREGGKKEIRDMQG
jgi:hypothetical protein